MLSASGAWRMVCGRCWRDAGLEPGSQRWIVLNQGGLQAGWFHPGYCYTDVVEGASDYLRPGGQGFWSTTNWPNRAYLLGRTGGFTVRSQKENYIALEATANATPARLAARYGGKRVLAWGSLDVYSIDQSLRKLELDLRSRSPLRWVES